ncbi:MAG: hypothetical protein LBC74_11805 [Planctomycetaceae bacterium]|jgi:hypothetical protein|nr:hypothetical protein [Planctomycetaceae bacterium]
MKYLLRNCWRFDFSLCRFFIAVTTIVIFFVVAGCHSFGERHIKIRDEFIGGKVDKAKSDVNRAIKMSSRKDKDLLKLNSAIIELCSGRPKSAELLLREVRDNFDRIEQEKATNAARNAASLITDDNSLAYVGEDYEKVLIRVFLAISNLMYDGTDAYAYAMQINDKQNKIIESRKNEVAKLSNNNSNLQKQVEVNYRNVPIGAYLSGLLLEETKRNYDDAYKNYEKAGLWTSDKKFGNYQISKDLERVKNGLHSKSGNGVVYVFVLAGRGPYKEQRNCQVLHEAQILTTAILSHVSDVSLIPDFAPIMIPVIVTPDANKLGYKLQSEIDVLVDNKFSGTAERITNISNMATAQFEANQPIIIARAIIRRAFKKGIIYGTKKATDANSWVGLALELGGMLWESLETADTRCWNLLPDHIQVYRVELPVGEHEITLGQILKTGGTKNNGYSKKIHVHDGRNTYVLANFIDNKLIGEITVSNENK